MTQISAWSENLGNTTGCSILLAKSADKNLCVRTESARNMGRPVFISEKHLLEFFHTRMYDFPYCRFTTSHTIAQFQWDNDGIH